MKIKDIRNKVRKYKEYKADIINIEITLKEKEIECIGITAAPQGEKTGQTYKITSPVEQQAEQHQKEVDKLLKKKTELEMLIKRIENGLSVLKEEERDVIEIAVIEQKKYSLLEIKYNRTYSRIKQIESEALIKMGKYIK